ncbi:MAG: carboxylesterase family protein, partial [Pseudomonadota bacterium]
VTHAADIPFFFDWTDPKNTIFLVHDASPVNVMLAEQWSKTIIAFARNGDPNGAGLPAWPRYQPDDYRCLRLAQTPEITANPDGELLSLYRVS